MKRKNFTLVEGIIVGIVLSVVSVIALVQYSSIKERTALEVAPKKLLKLLIAVEQFGRQQDRLPVNNEFSVNGLGVFGAKKNDFVCPATGQSFIYNQAVFGNRTWLWYTQKDVNDDYVNALYEQVVSSPASAYRKNGTTFGFGIGRNRTIVKF